MRSTRGYGLLENTLSHYRQAIAFKLIDNRFRDGNILDIGCGDGIIVCDAVKRFQAIGYGIEYHYLLMLCGRIRALITGVSSKTHFIWGNMYRMQYPEADVIFTYLFPETNKRLEPLLKASFPSGTRVVSRAFSYPTLPLITKKQEGRETIYLYQIP